MKRADGRLMKELGPSSRFYTFLMPARVTSSCWTLLSVNAEGLIKFIEEKEKCGEKYTVFQTVVAALIQTGAQFPQLNRFIYKHKIYARNEYAISFAVNTGDETVFRKLRFDPSESFAQIHSRIESAAESARKQPHDSLDKSMDFMMKLPSALASFILKMYPILVDRGIFPKKFADEDVLYTSAVVSNLGSFGIKAPFHHLYDWGSASVFVTVGEISKAPVVMPDDTIQAQRMLSIGFTLDERIADGKTIAEALKLFIKLIENPRLLEDAKEKAVQY